jgi:hypothetical protein
MNAWRFKGCRVKGADLHRGIQRIFLILTLITLTGCGNVRTGKLFAPTWFGFVEIAEGVYVDEPMPSFQRADFLETIQAAKGRVSSFFGRLKGKPNIFACSTEECFVSNGGITAKGNAYGSSMVLLSPRGLDVVTVSHELTHAELSSRVGDFQTWRAIPPWFDEGLAVLVSQDPRYVAELWLRATENGRRAPQLMSLGDAVPWRNWQMSYGTARHAVGEWYLRVGSKGLLHLIRELRGGKEFDAVFKAPDPRSRISNMPLRRSVLTSRIP